MQESDKIKMRVNVGGEVISLAVPFDDQDFVRDTEAAIADLFDTWSRRFPNKSVRELLAMMTYQYASYYLSLSRRQESLAAALQKCEARLDDTLAETSAPSAPPL